MAPLAPLVGKQLERILLMVSLMLARSLKCSLLRSNALILTGYRNRRDLRGGTFN